MTTPSLAGDWAYRFSGFTIMDGAPCYLVGMGVLNLSPDGKVTGKQSASITPLTGSKLALLNRVMDLSGTYSNEDGAWSKATLRFLDPGKEDERGTFDIIQVDADRFWMISTGAKQLNPNSPGDGKSSPADEVNSGEAVRIRSVS